MMRNKYFSITMLAVLIIMLGIYFAVTPTVVSEGRSFGKIIDDMTIFESIDELSFLEPYVTEKLDVELPEHAQTAYAVKLNYKDAEYTLIAYTFDSEENALAFYSEETGVPPEFVTRSQGMLDSVEHTAFARACYACSYYMVQGSNTEVLPELVSFISEHLTIPVDQGESQ